MRHFSIKITQGGSFIEYSAIARSSGQAMSDAFEMIEDDQPFVIMVYGQGACHA